MRSPVCPYHLSLDAESGDELPDLVFTEFVHINDHLILFQQPSAIGKCLMGVGGVSVLSCVFLSRFELYIHILSPPFQLLLCDLAVMGDIHYLLEPVPQLTHLTIP